MTLDYIFGQPTFTARTANLEDAGRAMGIANARTVTDAAKLQFDGFASLNITGMGEGRVTMNGLDFGDCTKSPKTGTLDLALINIEAATIEFTADKAGTFPFQCSNFCGFGHGKMKGKLIVEE